jgi:uncharacterized OsmC-like protein
VRVARDEKIELKEIEVEVKHKLNHLNETATSHYTATTSLKISEIRRAIRVRGSVDGEAAAKLLWGAEHCPVSNTIEGSVPVRTTIEVAAV